MRELFYLPDPLHRPPKLATTPLLMEIIGHLRLLLNGEKLTEQPG